MEPENNTESNTSDKNQDMIKVLREERDDIMRQKAENEFSINVLQSYVQAGEVELNNVNKLQSEMELQHAKLIEVVEKEIQTKLNFENDIEHIKRVTEVFGKDLKQLKNNLHSIETNTENMINFKNQLNKELEKYNDDKNLNKKKYSNEINKLGTLIKVEINNNHYIIQKNKLTLDKQNEELQTLINKDQELIRTLEQKQDKNSEIINEIEKKENNKAFYLNERTKLKEQLSEFVEHNKSTVTIYEDQIATLKYDIEKDNTHNKEMQDKIDLLNNEHQKQDEAISLHKINLNNLETEQCSTDDNVSALCVRLEELKGKLLNLQGDKNSELELLHGSLKHSAEMNITVSKTVKDVQEALEDKKKTVLSLRESLREKSEEKKRLCQHLEETQLKKEDTLDCEHEVNQYNDKIDEVKCRQKEEKSTVENLQNIIGDTLERIRKIEELIQTTNDKTKQIFMQKDVSLKNVNETLLIEKKRYDKLITESQKIENSITSELKRTEKNYKDCISKIEKEGNQFRENMDTIMKNDNDKYIKDRKSIEESIKTKLSQISKYRNSKDNLQEELAKKFKEILDVAQQIEGKNAEKTVKSKEAQSFKSPNPPKSKQTRKSKTSMLVAPIQKKIVKKTIIEEKQTDISSMDSEINDENTSKIFPLTQKAENENVEQKLVSSNKTYDADYGSIKSFSSAQQSSQKLKPKKLDFSDSPITTGIPAEKPEIKHTELPKTQPKDKSFLWATDIETSDDGFHRNAVSSQIKSNLNTQKSQSKHIEPSNTQIKSKCNIWPTDLETSDDGFRKKSVSSQIKSGLNTDKPKTIPIDNLNTQIKDKSSLWTTDNDSSDDGFPKNINSTQKKIRSPLTQKKESGYEFSDQNSPIDDFESLKSNITLNKKVDIDNTRSSASSQLRKRPTVNYYIGDSSDDSFQDKINKSKKIQSNLRSSAKPSVINLDSSFSE